MRHGHKTWMAEDGTSEILAEHRLGHEVPGMRGLYAYTSDRMREDLERTLQARWEDSLRERAALHENSPVPLLDELLAPFRAPAPEQMTARDTEPDHPTPGVREKMISQIPPNQAESPSPGRRLGLKERASDLVRDQIPEVELRGFEPLTPSMRSMATPSGAVARRRVTPASGHSAVAARRDMAGVAWGRCHLARHWLPDLFERGDPRIWIWSSA
jgi:hypothetical protein